MTEDPTIKETFDTFLEKAGWIESKSDPLLLYTLWYLRFKRFALLSNENVRKLFVLTNDYRRLSFDSLTPSWRNT